jgi:hypothetical protein
MHCNYCGVEISTDDVVRAQKLGVDTDNDEGVAVEVERFITSATCDSCGTQTNYEFGCRDDLFNLEISYDDERESTA